MDLASINRSSGPDLESSAGDYASAESFQTPGRLSERLPHRYSSPLSRVLRV